ncbi:MAG: glycoside hydrolase family protein [Bacteroidota bacterium]
MMKKIFLTSLLVFGFGLSRAQQRESTGVPEEKMFFDNTLAAPVGGGFSMEDYWVWGSSVIYGDDGLYHMFVSRWPKHLPFHPGWMVASEVVHATSKTPEGPYQFSDVTLPARGAQYWDGRSTHNPRITRYKDTYILFYMGSTHPFDEVKDPVVLTLESPYATVARSNKRIGIATSKSPYGPWERRDAPALNTKPDTFYSFLTSNPAPLIHDDGSVLLIFKSRSYKDTFPFQGEMSIGVAKAPHFNGPYTVVGNEPIFGKDHFGEVEDPFLWRDKNGYHLIVKDQRGGITGHKHSGVIAHSDDGLNWRLDKNPLAYTKTIHWSNDATQIMGQLERAFALIENGTITHLFFATMDGPGGFNNATRSWNMVLPLKQENHKKK